MTQTINVPMQSIQPVTSISDAVGKWTDINRVQQGTELAKQQEARLQNQNERENKLGDLQFGQHQRKAHNEVMTEFKTVLQKKAQAAGIQPNTPEYQQLANATYATGFDKIMQNAGAPPYKMGTNIDLSAVDALTTAQDKRAMERQYNVEDSNDLQPNKLAIAREQAGIAQAQQERGFDQQKGMEDIRYGHDLKKAQLENQWKTDAKMEIDQAKQQAAQDKPLPATIVKEQQKLREQIDTASQMNKMLSTFEKQLDDGKLNLSLTGNLANKARNYLGASTDESTALSSFQSGMEKMRNDSLRLNSGVQTEGDAVRAWNELFANINDEKVVKQRLAEIRGYNESAINFKKADINAMRSEYGKGEFDDSAYQGTKTATPQELPEGYEYATNPKTGEKIPVRKK